MTKKIGFRNYNDPDKQENDQEKAQREKNKAIAKFISANYSPIGATSQKCYKTTAELAYDLSNIIAVSQKELATQLTAAGYRCEFLSGKPFWVMYER
nr:MAG TPA: hypothetical protein [Caudoviricetes sp.]